MQNRACDSDAIFTGFLVDFGQFWEPVWSQYGAKLAPKSDQKSTRAKIHKNQVKSSLLGPNWVRSTQDGGQNRPKIDQKPS